MSFFRDLLITTLSLAFIIAATSEVSAEETFSPLADPTEENIVYQLTRCSAFYSAFHGLLLEKMLNTDDPIERSSVKELTKRSADNSDGLLTTAVIVATQIEGLDDAEAVDRITDERSGLAASYIRQFVLDGASVSAPFQSPLWKNDTAACAAFVETLGNKQ